VAAASPSPSKLAAARFALFGLEVDFELDGDDLDARLLQASLAWHPDRFVSAPTEQLLAAEDKMAEFNEAHAQLADPVKRAELLLAYLGAPATQGTDTQADPAFLMEMMELREAAEEAAAQLPAQSEPALRFIVRMRNQEQLLLDKFAKTWQSESGQNHAALHQQALADGEVSHPHSEALRRIFYELRYFQRTRESLEEKLEALAQRPA